MVFFNGMKDVLVPIDQAGRIVLPKSVRLELAVKPGDKFKLSVHGTAVTLTPSRQKAGLIRKGKALVFSTGSTEALTQEAAIALLEDAREEREERVRGQYHHK